MGIIKRAAALPRRKTVISATNSVANSIDWSRFSDEQNAIIDWETKSTGNLFVEALAGTGKTTTIIALSTKMSGNVAFAAFNKKIADEIKSRVNNSVRVGTFHSFGLRAWAIANGRNVVVDAYKSSRMCDELNVPWEWRDAIKLLVSFAKQSGVGVVWDAGDTEVWRGVVEHYSVLDQVRDGSRRGYGNSTAEEDDKIVDDLMAIGMKGVDWCRSVPHVIDFDDMLWLPLVEGVRVEKYDRLLVDEAQDTNVVRRLLAEAMMGKDSRAVFIGDRHQSIYGFTGADHDAVDLIINHFDCKTLPLTTTFRCSHEATKLAQQFVPAIVAHPSNEQGCVLSTGWPVPLTTTASSGFGVEARSSGGLTMEFSPGDAILCRNTKPLIVLAFMLLKKGIGCHVEGKDIGRSIEVLVNKWRVETVRALVVNLESYREKETQRLRDKHGDRAAYRVAALDDRVDTVLALCEDCTHTSQVRQKISSMFKDTDNGSSTITLSTVHKAKGREWARVFVLGWNEYMPSQWARQDWEKIQEHNIQYVAVTRTKRDLVLMRDLPREK